MSTIQEKWNHIYANANVDADACPRLLRESLHLLPQRGRALDVACGLGAASITLARRGLEVVAWDISPVAIDKLRAYADQHELAITADVVDLSRAEIPEEAFDVICVNRFLDRDLCGSLARALRPDGLLVYQTFSLEALEAERHKSPNYCLVRGELLALFRDLRPIVYREEALVGDITQGLRNEAYLLAQRARPAPRFFVDWVRRVTDDDDPAALSRAIARHRNRIAALPDHLAPLAAGERAAREREWGLLENADVVIVPDSCVPTLRALVILKGNYLLPTDLPEAALHRLGHVVDAIADAFSRITGAARCRCWTPHPDDYRTRRLVVFVDPDRPITDLDSMQAVWNEVSACIRQTIAS